MSFPVLDKLPQRASALTRRLGVDRAVAFTLFGRTWFALAGVATLLLLTHFLSGPQQGFYFQFADILGLQIFFELGLAHVIVQFASHEFAGLHWTDTGIVEGTPAAKTRLASLLRLIVRWYGVTALLIILVLLPAGSAFFLHYGSAYPNIGWQTPWVWIVFVTAGSLAVSPLLAVLEGCGLIAQIARLQLILGVIGSVLFWIALSRHYGLYTAPVTNTVAFAGTVVWLWLKKRQFFSDLWRTLASPNPVSEEVINWKREVWPLQWKIALSWLSSYFIFKLFGPLLFVFEGRVQGPIAAGRMDLSLTVVSAISGIALAWVATKSASFGTLIARREFDELDRRFFPCMRQSVFVLACCAALVWIATFLLFKTGSPLRLRVLEPLPMALLMGATVVTHVVVCEAVYLRAHKQEPFLVMSLVWGGLVCLSSVTLGWVFGVTGMMLGYLIVSTVVGLGGGTWLFVQKRALWHGPAHSVLGKT